MDRIGRYEIVSELGRGGMGVVYHCVDPIISRHVAIKTILFTQARDSPEIENLKKRFLIEARLAGTLTHPNIVTIFDAGEEAGTVKSLVTSAGPALDTPRTFT